MFIATKEEKKKEKNTKFYISVCLNMLWDLWCEMGERWWYKR
jgi:hypothetical protein